MFSFNLDKFDDFRTIDDVMTQYYKPYMRCLGGQEMMPMSIVRNGNLMNCHHIWYISNV
jgi:hypothetical protein